MEASPATKGSESICLGPWNGYICACLHMANTNQVHWDKSKYSSDGYAYHKEPLHKERPEMWNIWIILPIL